MDVSNETVEGTNLRRPLVDPADTEEKLPSKVGLESVLMECNLSYRRRIYLGACIEMKLLFRLALPAILIYIVNTGMGISARIFAGHVGGQELAAASIGNSCFNLVYGLMVRFSLPYACVETRLDYYYFHLILAFSFVFSLLTYKIINLIVIANHVYFVN